MSRSRPSRQSKTSRCVRITPGTFYSNTPYVYYSTVEYVASATLQKRCHHIVHKISEGLRSATRGLRRSTINERWLRFTQRSMQKPNNSTNIIVCSKHVFRVPKVCLVLPRVRSIDYSNALGTRVLFTVGEVPWYPYTGFTVDAYTVGRTFSSNVYQQVPAVQVYKAL